MTDRLRIAVVHSFYSSSQPSGENECVLQEVAALRRAGHQVELFAAHTDQLERQALYRLRAGTRVATGHGRNPLKEIRVFSPDVVHVHNLFPNFGRAWVEDIDVPVAHTLHNYRPLCASGLLYRNGSICTLCPDGDRYAGLRFGCYRDCRAATLPLSIANRRGPANDPLLARADVLFVLTELQRQQYVRAGVPEERLVVHPNFLSDDLSRGFSPTAANGAFVAVGRLTPEKGIGRLAKVWPSGVQLAIVGDGPDLETIQSLAKPNVRLLGSMANAETIEVIRQSTALVFPSRCFEGLPRVAIEAWACGTPVVATPGNSIAAMIESHGGGRVVPWEDVAAVIQSMDPDERDREDARRVFETYYTESAFVERLQVIYQRLLGIVAA